MRRLPLALLAFAALTATAADRPRNWVDAAPDGPAAHCIPLNNIEYTRVRDDRTIDFYTHGRRVYRNVLPHDCPELGFEERFAYATSLSQLCNVDIITVLHTSGPIPGASCGLGDFQPVTLADAKARK